MSSLGGDGFGAGAGAGRGFGCVAVGCGDGFALGEAAGLGALALGGRGVGSEGTIGTEGTAEAVETDGVSTVGIGTGTKVTAGAGLGSSGGRLPARNRAPRIAKLPTHAAPTTPQTRTPVVDMSFRGS